MARRIKAAIEYCRALIRGNAPEGFSGNGVRGAHLDEESESATVWLRHPLVSSVSVEPGAVQLRGKAGLTRRVRLARFDLKKALTGYSIRSTNNRGRLKHEVYLEGQHAATISRDGYRAPFFFHFSSRHAPKLITALFGKAVKLSLPVKRGKVK